MAESKNNHGGGLRRGVVVFGGLLVLSLLEYWVAVGLESGMPLLVLIMITKAVLIVDSYMHLRSIAVTTEGDH